MSATINSITYSLTNNPDQASVTDIAAGAGANVDIPASISDGGTDYAVTQIADGATIDPVVTSVTFPDSLDRIGISAFAGSNLAGDLVIPIPVTSIDASAFANCSGLDSIDFPTTLTTFDKTCIYGCTNLFTISIGINQLSAIANDTNQLQTRVKTLTVKSQGGIDETLPVCANMTNLETISVDSTIVIFSPNQFENCSALTSFTIPFGCESLPQDMFYGCTSLTSIGTIPSTVTTIGISALRNTGLTSINVPETVTIISNGAFQDNAYLTDLSLNAILTNASMALSNCSLVWAADTCTRILACSLGTTG